MDKLQYLPKLYKRTNTGAIQEWLVGVKGTTIVTHFGQVGGKIQTTTDSVKSGKNQGRKNETAVEEQAVKEAKSHWTKKKKAGYVESLKDAESGETDDIIEGGILPMLAKVYEDHSHKIDWARNIFVQPKLDGIRCIAIFENGEVTLWSRTRKKITSCPEIEKSLLKICNTNNMSKRFVFDGELYSDKLKNDFEKIVSAVRKQKPSKDSARIDYFVYDCISDFDFKDRIETVRKIVAACDTRNIKITPTYLIPEEGSVKRLADSFVSAGYEGAMIRLGDRPYESKRSDQLLKLKTFMDEEFQIVGVEEGRGKLSGHAGAFICQTLWGATFNVKMSGETEKLIEYFENFENYKGKMLTVKYQGLTADGIPRFPVGLRLREEEL